MNLLEHSKDCAPLIPCKACEIVAWLRGKLNEADFAELTNRAQLLAPEKRRRRDRSGLGPRATLTAVTDSKAPQFGT